MKWIASEYKAGDTFDRKGSSWVVKRTQADYPAGRVWIITEEGRDFAFPLDYGLEGVIN